MASWGFFERVKQDPISGCWNWQLARDRKGYGRVFFRGKQHFAHRVSAVLFKGFDLNSPLCIIHTCDTPSCVNPAHLRPGTHLENMRDSFSKGRNPRVIARTHCAHGHPYSGQNLYVQPNGVRICRACKKRYNAKGRK